VDTGGNIFEGLLVDLRCSAKGIGDIPVFDFFGMIEDGVAARASEIDDQVGVIPSVARDGFRRKGFGGVAVGMENVEGGGRDVAQREKAGAGGIENVGGIAAGDGFGDGAATGVAEAEEEDAETSGTGHGRIVARRIGEETERRREKITQRRRARGGTQRKKKPHTEEAEFTEKRNPRALSGVTVPQNSRSRGERV
jgi:hypothetical protein